ncbi:MAG: sigma 54-interacting transcriptional regulator [Polyangiaceae bacterium]|nr:sigma 54-interacting transcriptional regulator [Polyangiaceae bacterium]
MQRAAPSVVPVLLFGESGSGQELACTSAPPDERAQAAPVHARRVQHLPETLFESELFGYEYCAFTGANSANRDLVDATVGGTLFVVEIGNRCRRSHGTATGRRGVAHRAPAAEACGRRVAALSPRATPRNLLRGL